MFRVANLTLGFAVALIILSTSFTNLAYPQPGPQTDRNDPRQTPIPELDFQ